jgi:TRAP-type mannitol/chloroaromatic compound transport system permease small subunit
MPRLEKAIKVIDSISTWVGIPVSWMYMILTFIVCYDVTARYFFDAPTAWVFDYSIQLYGTAFMLCGAYALAQNNHVRCDMVYRKFPVRVQAAIDFVMYFIFFFPGILALVWSGYEFAAMAWGFKERSIAVPSGPPIYPFKAVIPIAGALIALQGISEVLRCVVAMKTGVWPERFEDVQEAP